MKKLKNKKAYKDKFLLTLEKLSKPSFKENVIEWQTIDGDNFLGSFLGEELFKIKRGIIFFKLKVVHKDMKQFNKTFGSVELVKLQKKANEILKSDVNFLLKFKAIF